MREAFALQKVSHFFQQKYLQISDTNFLNCNKMLTNDLVSFEQPDQTLMETEIFPTINRVKLLTVFHNHPPIDLI